MKSHVFICCVLVYIPTYDSNKRAHKYVSLKQLFETRPENKF